MILDCQCGEMELNSLPVVSMDSPSTVSVVGVSIRITWRTYYPMTQSLKRKEFVKIISSRLLNLKIKYTVIISPQTGSVMFQVK